MPHRTGKAITISGVTVEPGSRQQIDIPVNKLFDATDISISVEVVNGWKPGPVLFVAAAIHGDEINGVEITKRLLQHKRINTHMHGTLIAIPVVNAFGFNRNTRYLPDRRDLNRCFPGHEKGSLGSQMAYIFMKEVVEKCTHGIDLHTGAFHRNNLPQIRANLDDEVTRNLSDAFDVPVAINSATRDGSLRQAAAEKGIPMLLYEGGEMLRYDPKVIQTGLRGILSVMQSIGMFESKPNLPKPHNKHRYIARSSYWERAPQSGSFTTRSKLGKYIQKGESLGELSDPFGRNKCEIISTKSGIIVGMTMTPLVNTGDALFHIATFEDNNATQIQIEEFDNIINIGNFE